MDGCGISDANKEPLFLRVQFLKEPCFAKCEEHFNNRKNIFPL